MMNEETTMEKKAKTEEVRVIGNLEHKGKAVPVGDKMTLRVDQVERLVGQRIVERIRGQ